MDILAFIDTPASARINQHLVMDQAAVVNKLKTKMWVERYQRPGEFKLTSHFPEETMIELPLGTFISHMNTTELMIVENHQIFERNDRPAELVVTGRSFWAPLLEDRIFGTFNAENEAIVGAPVAKPISNEGTCADVIDYILDYEFESTKTPLNGAINNFNFRQSIERSEGPTLRYQLNRVSLYQLIEELLKRANLGIKGERWKPSPSTLRRNDATLTVHDGKDLTDSASDAMFSHIRGDIKNAEYFKSIKGEKNEAWVIGYWIDRFVGSAGIGFEKKQMSIDGKDIDQSYTTKPTGTDRTNIESEMVDRAVNNIEANNQVSIMNVEIDPGSDSRLYRVDYNIGDIVKVLGKYGVSTSLRVSEHVEIEDENGFSSYPTLSEYIV